METPAIREGIVAACVAILDGKGETQDLADYLTPRQLGKLNREAKSEGFKGAGDFVEKFMESAMRNLIADASPVDDIETTPLALPEMKLILATSPALAGFDYRPLPAVRMAF